jgi:hypothetical protein
MIIENPLNQNRMLTARQALDLGIVDAMIESAEFLERSLAWAARVIKSDARVPRREVERNQTGWAAAITRGKALADSRVHGAAPAPYRALKLIELARTVSRDAGFAAEDEALADLTLTDQLHAGLYSFDLVRKRAKKPAGALTVRRPAHGPPGRQDRDRGCGLDGRSTRAAVRPAARRARRDDRSRPDPTRQGVSGTCIAKSTSWSRRTA